MTMVESKSGFRVMVKMAHKTSNLVRGAIVERLKPFAYSVKTLIYDNDKVFALHIQTDQALQSNGFIAIAFVSWERDSNLNFNGLLRKNVPKKISMNKVVKMEITTLKKH